MQIYLFFALSLCDFAINFSILVLLRMQFKHVILFLVLLAPACVSAQLQTSPRGMRYQVIERKPTVGRPRGLSLGDNLSIRLYTANHKDSIVHKQILDDITLDASTSPIDVRDVLPFLFPGDSVVCLVKVDTFARYTGRAMPSYFPQGSEMKHFIRVVKAESSLEQQARDAQIIQDYAKANNLQTKITPSGLHYVITQTGTGTTPSKGQKVTVHYRGTLLDGKEFDASYARNRPFSFAIGTGQVIKGWDEGIALLPAGSKATLLIPSTLGYGKRGAGGMIPPSAVLRFDIEVLDVPSEKRIIDDYAKANQLQLNSTPSGLQYIITRKGSGALPKKGQTIAVHYRGTLLDGKEFDSSYSRNTPIEFSLGMGQVIRGWDEGLALLPVGSKAIFIIPSELGYGSRGAGADIPPDAVLRFDVELVAIK
jgi:peptidylprolyl isomerase